MKTARTKTEKAILSKIRRIQDELMDLQEMMEELAVGNDTDAKDESQESRRAKTGDVVEIANDKGVFTGENKFRGTLVRTTRCYAWVRMFDGKLKQKALKNIKKV